MGTEVHNARGASNLGGTMPDRGAASETQCSAFQHEFLHPHWQYCRHDYTKQRNLHQVLDIVTSSHQHNTRLSRIAHIPSQQLTRDQAAGYTSRKLSHDQTSSQSSYIIELQFDRTAGLTRLRKRPYSDDGRPGVKDHGQDLRIERNAPAHARSRCCWKD